MSAVDCIAALTHLVTNCRNGSQVRIRAVRKLAFKAALLRGYQSFVATQTVIDALSGGRLQGRAPERTPENLLGII